MAIKFCFLCYKGINSLGNHLRWEHPTVSLQNYYDKFFKKEYEGFCQNENCNNETQFNSSKWHYNTYCCNKCMKTSDVYKQRCSTGVKQVWKLRTNEERKEIGQKILKKNNENPNVVESRKHIFDKIYGNKTEDEIKEIKNKRLHSLSNTWENRTKKDNLEMQNKSRKTRLKNHGDETWNNRDKAKKTYKERTGYEYWMQTPVARKMQKERFENYTEEEMNTFRKSVSDGLNNMDDKKKTKCIQNRVKTMKNKSDKEKNQILIKKQNTWKQKTTEELHKIHTKAAHNTCHKYIYKNLDFHSFDEMAFFIYNVECLHEKIIRNNLDFYFNYDYDNRVFSYYPDFKINEKYIEIKGLHFFENKNPNGKMICPYHKKEDTPETIAWRNGKFEAKHQCMIHNKVEIITDTDKYKQYVINKYGNVQRID